MGTLLSRHGGTVVPEAGTRRNHSYTYPTRDGGDYFSSHYHLGPRKFETAESEQFLFGEMADLNFLTAPPTAFPYKQLSSKRQPLNCLYSLLNVHRESVRLVRVENRDSDSHKYNIEFVFDTDVSCKVMLYHYLPDNISLSSLRDGPSTHPGPVMSHCFKYEKGLEQKFSHPTVTVSPTEMIKEQLVYNPEIGQNLFPVCIVVETSNTDGYRYQSQLTVCNLEELREGVHVLKVIKQKLFVDGVEYLLHEIYGLENKKTEPQKDTSPEPERSQDNEEVHAKQESDDDDDDDDDEDEEDLGAECVICFTDVRDTILLPCRHFCLCASCAADLRYQASNCPICRFPFRALLQIQAVHSGEPRPSEDEVTDNPRMFTEQGHRLVSILQVLNGYPAITEQNCNHNSPDAGEACVTREEEEEDGEEQEDQERRDTCTSDQIQEEAQQNTSTPESTTIVIPIEGGEGMEEDADKTTVGLQPVNEAECYPNNHSNGVAHQAIPLPGTPVSSEEGDVSLNTTESILTSAVVEISDRGNGSRCDSTGNSEDQYSSTECLVRKSSVSSQPMPEDGRSFSSSGSVSSTSSHEPLLLVGRRRREGGQLEHDVSTV